MTLAALVVVLLSIILVLAYALPAADIRLDQNAEKLVLAQAARTADEVSGASGEGLQSALDASAGRPETQVLVTDDTGEVVARSGPRLLAPDAPVLRETSGGSRLSAEVDGVQVARVPLVENGNLAGEVVVASDRSTSSLFRIFLRSGLEAAAIAGLLGGALMFGLATFLSRRVERLNAAAKAVERGDFSRRVEDFSMGDELSNLAKTFNSMADNLQGSFDKLEEKDETMTAVLENLTEGVLATDLDGRVLVSNPVAREMLGIRGTGDAEDPSHTEPLPDLWKDFDLPEAVRRCAREQDCGQARVSEGESVLQITARHMPAFDDHKGGVLVVMQDLSEERRLEADQQRFLTNAAHEFRTPLSTIISAAELLASGAEEDPQARERFLGHLLSAAGRMQRLSDTLLRLAQVGRNLRAPEPEPCDPGEVAGRAVHDVRPLAEGADVGIRVKGAGTTVEADAGLLGQALMVVLSNAIKHSPPGKDVVLRLAGPEITVEDEGPGISKEDLPHVFERFYRGRQDTGGFGLGLAICKEIVEGMGGRISIESEEGVGTRVNIELPEAG